MHGSRHTHLAPADRDANPNPRTMLELVYDEVVPGGATVAVQ